MLGRETKVVKALLASDYGVFGVEDLIFFGECCEVPSLLSQLEFRRNQIGVGSIPLLANWVPEESFDAKIPENISDV